jgi:hypothetical protein
MRKGLLFGIFASLFDGDVINGFCNGLFVRVVVIFRRP